jgi:hypothetical protein
MISYKQISFKEIFYDRADLVKNDKFYFLCLLENTMNLNNSTPVFFK